MVRFASLMLTTLALSACGVPAEKAETPAPAPAKVEKPAPAPAPEAAADDWKAPASTRDPAACKDAERPQPVDVATLEPMTLGEDANPALKDVALAADTAPELYKVNFETSEGNFVVEVHRDWAPIGADRFYNLVKIGYFDDIRTFRNIGNFMVQFGIHGAPEVNAVWSEARIKDEPVKMGNKRGIITCAKCGAPDCRSTQVFINHKDNTMLDPQGFAGFGRVIEGMDVVDKLYACYGEGAPRGMGPSQGLIQSKGNAYLDAGWPNLSRIVKATVVE